MHGLTGGSWKRSRDRTTATEKNDPTGNRAVTSGSVTYRRSHATAPAPDPPSDVLGELFPALRCGRWRYRNRMAVE